MGPLWASILGYCLNGEAVSKFQIMCMIGSFVGVIILSLSKSGEEDNVTSKRNFYVGLIAALLCGFCFSFSTVLTRKLKGLHYSIIQFHYGLISTFILTIWVVIDCFHEQELRFLTY